MGLNQSLDAFPEHGYVVVPELVSRDEAAALYAALDRIPKFRWNNWRATANERALLQEERFFDVLVNTRFFDVVRQLVGEDVQVLDYQALEIAPSGGKERDWHADFRFFSTPTLTVNCGIYLTDMTPEVGPLYVVPGSHRWAREPSPEEAERSLDGEVEVAVAAGTLVAFDGQLWHTGTRNASQHPRRALFPYCSHYWVKRMDEFYKTPLPRIVAESDDPRVKQLFGIELASVSMHGPSYSNGHPAFE